MTYQDPPSSQDSAQGPRRPGDRATSGYRASHQRPQGHQDVREGNPPDADRAAGAFWNPGRQQPQGGGRPPWDTRGREQDQGGGQAPFRNPGREQPQGGGQAPFGSAGREQYPGDGQAPVRNPWYQEQQPEAGWDDPADLRWPRQTAGEPPDDPTGPGGRRRGLIAGALIGVL